MTRGLFFMKVPNRSSQRGKSVFTFLGLSQVIQGLIFLVGGFGVADNTVANFTATQTQSFGYALLLGGFYLVIFHQLDEPEIVRSIAVLFPVLNWLTLSINELVQGNLSQGVFYMLALTFVLSLVWGGPRRGEDGLIPSDICKG